MAQCVPGTGPREVTTVPGMEEQLTQAAAGRGSRGRGTMGHCPLPCPGHNETLLPDPWAKEPQLLFSKSLKRS